jgi:predicted nucleic acid-binding protein
MRIILDTNIVLDVLMKREPHYKDSYRVIRQAIQDELGLFFPTGCVTDAYFVLYKSDRKKAKESLEQFIRLIEMCEVVPEDIETAFASKMEDFEDAVLAAVADRMGADYIVTRNEADFVHSPVPGIKPEKLLAIMQEKS